MVEKEYKYRRKRSPIWLTHSDDQFIDLFNKSKSITELLGIFGLKVKGGNGNTLRKRCEHLGLSYEDKANSGKAKSYRIRQDRIPLGMTENSTLKRSTVKRYLIRENIIPYRCSVCSLKPFWNGKTLTLILDHINGISNDNRVENLRFVCGNCNSQLPTHCGGNK